jgi:hypothetical protein
MRWKIGVDGGRWVMVVAEGELGLAFVVLSFRFNVVRILVLLVFARLCRSLLIINETNASAKQA